ncbi:unnamed protein product [Phytomonas sp. Hart1]|nr:unnamed protein product [Phytomonas sp. Hart1]|eukprot:CCW67570.1 unnamed protein product [Phytomonas sp. isolate Hart1]
MAKSTRSKWKKLHRRQRAEAERERTAARIRGLHHKLELTSKGGISAVPPQEPETRFHFLNPDLDPRAPKTSRGGNPNPSDPVQIDFTKPLKLPPPRTCFYGKSDPNGPHPQATNYEVLDANAPIAGHALTTADVERMLNSKNNHHNNNKEADNVHPERGPSNPENDPFNENEEGEDDGPEEYVFELEKSTWHKAPTSEKKTQKKGQSKSTGKATKNKDQVVVEDTARDVEEEEDGRRRRAPKIKSMETPRKREGAIVAAGGSSKMKKILTNGSSSANKGVETRRLVSSGSKAAKKLAKPLLKGKKAVVL